MEMIMSTLRKVETNYGHNGDLHELQDTELEAVSGGASMVEYAPLMFAVLSVAAKQR
jgi:hypothetical protein